MRSVCSLSYSRVSATALLIGLSVSLLHPASESFGQADTSDPFGGRSGAIDPFGPGAPPLDAKQQNARQAQSVLFQAEAVCKRWFDMINEGDVRLEAAI